MKRHILLVLALALAVPGVVPAADVPECAAMNALAGLRTSDVSDAAAVPGAPLRVFAIQFKQDPAYVVDYATFALKMDCLMKQYVVPHLHPTAVNLVVFNEDIGLATLATGSRGAAARAIAASPARGNPQISDLAPASAAVALGAVGAGYARSLAAYRLLFPDEDPRRAILTAATDTFVRGFMTTFSRIARTYGVYVVASNNQPNFAESTDPADIAAFSDPDLASEYASGELKSVWKATSAEVWNQALLWAPDDVTSLPGSQLDWLDEQLGAPHGTTFPQTTAAGAYDPRSNLIAVNKKVPLTQIEKDFLALSEGDAEPHNTGPFVIPALGSAYRFGFAISLPAFVYGAPYGQTPANRCAADGSTWMHCLDARGVNVVLQPEANPGPWQTGADGIGSQAVSWGASTLRAVRDPAVSFEYLVCPHMVGNLLDIAFDGQSAIMQRGRAGAGRHYAGAGVPLPEDGAYQIYAGEFPEFLALAPWVLEDGNPTTVDAERAVRAVLRQRSQDLRAGSGSPHENRYLETAIYADLKL